MAFERNTAIKCTVQDIIKSVFVKKEGFESSYCSTDYGNIARANIMGVIVSVDGNVLTLDDGTEKLTLRSFEPLPHIPELGDIVTIIGKPREYNQERYLVPEILKIIHNPLWIDVRKQELAKREKQQPTTQPTSIKESESTEKEIKKEFSVSQTKEIAPKEETVEEEGDIYTKVKQFLKENDSGGGVSIAQLETLHIDQFENVLNMLLAEGEVYEIKPGFIKILD